MKCPDMTHMNGKGLIFCQTLSKVKVKKKKNHAPKLIRIYALKKSVLTQQISAYSFKYSLQ